MGAGEDRIAAIFSRTKATLSRWRDAVAVDAAMSVVRGETHQPCPTVAILRIMSDGYSDEGANSPALRDGPGLEGRRVADVAIERASRVYLSADGVGLGACETASVTRAPGGSVEPRDRTASKVPWWQASAV